MSRNFESDSAEDQGLPREDAVPLSTRSGSGANEDQELPWETWFDLKLGRLDGVEAFEAEHRLNKADWPGWVY